MVPFSPPCRAMPTPTGLLFLILFLSSVVHSLTDEFFFNGFQEVATLSLDGAALITSNGVLQLTNNTMKSIGHAFFSSPVQMLNNHSLTPSACSFSTAFVFGIITTEREGGHGFTFVISPSKVLPHAQWGQYLGVFGVENNGNFSNHVFAIEFDTVQSLGLFKDIDDNHVGVDINSLVSNVSETASYYSNDNKKVGIELESGEPIQAWIDYDGPQKILNVTISPQSVPKPRRPLISKRIDLSPILKEYMYVGFSGATGKLSSFHCILGWSFRVNGLSRPLDLSQLPKPSLSAERSLGSKAGGLKIGILSSVITVLLIVLIISVSGYLWQRAKLSETIENWELDFPHRFPYKDLYKATKGFKEKELLGSGGFGQVYKGILPKTGEELAIKRISNRSGQGVREFVAEISSLGRLRHRNLVQLQGWCKRNDDLLLAYEFMPNGSLDMFLFEHKKSLFLSWEQRFRILKDIASGLLYLHEEWEQVVVHRDIKASNVLLDANMNGRLGDFGLARLYEHGTNPHTTHVVGTLGYIAPELSRAGKATASSDVFAYGSLLLEVACGRRPIEPTATTRELILSDWLRECRMKGRLLEAVDPTLGLSYVREEMELVLKLGLVCSQAIPEARPTMRQVTQYLNGDDCLTDDVVLVFSEADSLELASRLSYPSSFGVSTGSLHGGR